MALTALALTYVDILRAIDAHGPLPTPAEVAHHSGRPGKNISREIQLLRDAEPALAIAGPKGFDLTQAGRDALLAIARANGEGAIDAPQGVLHHLIIPDPDQPRKHFDDDEIATLADVMDDSKWVSPLLLRPGADVPGAGWGHLLCAGERRWRAIGLLIETGRWDPLKPVPAEVRDMDDATHAEIALIENLQRRDLRPLEEARAFRRAIDVFGRTTAELALKVGYTQRFVQQRLQLLELSEGDQVRLESGAINIEDARRILASKPEPVNLPDDQAILLLEIAHRVATDEDAYLWTNIAVGAAVHADPLMTQVYDGQLAYRGFSPSRGENFVSLRSHGIMPRALWELIGVDKLDAAAIAAALAARYEQANTRPGEGRTYIHSWLNAPFALTKEQKAQAEAARAAETERADRYQAQQQERQAAIQARRGLAGELEALAFGGAGARPDTAVADALSRAGHPLPWSWSPAAGEVFDANGDVVDLGEIQDLVGPLVMALVNATAGAPPQRLEVLPDDEAGDEGNEDTLNVADLTDGDTPVTPTGDAFSRMIKRVVSENPDQPDEDGDGDEA